MGDVRLTTVAHWVFDFDVKGSDSETVIHHGGWIANQLKAIDFAGGTAVHINAGTAGWCWQSSSAKQLRLARFADAPAQPPFVMSARACCQFSWYGFNAGSTVSANGVTGSTTKSPPRSRPRQPYSPGSSPSASVTCATSWAPHRASSRTGRHHAVLLVGECRGRIGDWRRRGALCAWRWV